MTQHEDGRSAIDEVIRVWTSTYDGLGEQEIGQRVSAFRLIARAIAAGEPVSGDSYAAQTGLSRETVSEVFRGLSASGMEFDADGNLIGAALTTVRTPHRFRVNGRDLFAWCALDTLILPGLIGETAEVVSSCAATGDEIRLRVTPGAEAEYTPAEAVLTVVLPGVSDYTGATGPKSPT